MPFKGADPLESKFQVGRNMWCYSGITSEGVANDPFWDHVIETRDKICEVVSYVVTSNVAAATNVSIKDCSGNVLVNSFPVRLSIPLKSARDESLGIGVRPRLHGIVLDAPTLAANSTLSVSITYRILAVQPVAVQPWVFSDNFDTPGKYGCAVGWTNFAIGHATDNPRETGNDGTASVANDQITYVNSPGRAGEKCAQFSVVTTDWFLSADDPTKERCEFIRDLIGEAVDGSDWWYGWSVYIPTAYVGEPTAAGQFQTMGQFHPGGTIGSGPQPVIALRYESDDIGAGGTYNKLIVHAGLGSAHADITGEDADAGGETFQDTTINISRNAWYDIKLHVGWARGNGKGYVETYVNNVLQTPDLGGTRMNVGTMYDGRPATFRLGIYRGVNQAQASLFNIGRVRISRANNF